MVKWPILDNQNDLREQWYDTIFSCKTHCMIMQIKQSATMATNGNYVILATEIKYN